MFGDKNKSVSTVGNLIKKASEPAGTPSAAFDGRIRLQPRLKEIRGYAVALAPVESSVLVLLEARRRGPGRHEAASLKPQLKLRARVLPYPGLREGRIRLEESESMNFKCRWRKLCFRE